MRDVHRVHLKRLLSAKRRKGYAKNTVRLMRAAISSLLTDAVEEGIIAINPALQIANRKRKRSDRPTRTEQQQRIRPLDRQQLQTFLATAEEAEPKFAAFFCLLAKTGLRPGEARGLHFVGDVDLDKRTLRVERALSDTRIKGTKTDEIREVDLSPELIQVLRRTSSQGSYRSSQAGLGRADMVVLQQSRQSRLRSARSEWRFTGYSRKPGFLDFAFTTFVIPTRAFCLLPVSH